MSDVTRVPNSPMALGLASDEPFFSPAELRAMPPGMRIFFSPDIRAYFENMALEMSQSRGGGLGKHLQGDPALCFSIIRDALNWGLDPYRVAACTYSVHGTIGYYGKLIRGILFKSGKIKGITYEYGPSAEAWQCVEGKFNVVAGRRTDQDGNPVKRMVAAYTPDDEKGLWCKAHAIGHDGEVVGSTEAVFLSSCHPRNSTVWAYSPAKQIKEVLSRQISDLVCPDVMFGARFDVGLSEPENEFSPQQMRDITPDADPEAGMDDDIITFADEDAAPVADVPSPKKGQRIKIEFQGEIYGKTKFINTIRRLVREVETGSQLAQLHTEFMSSLRDKSTAHNALLQQLQTMFLDRSKKLNESDDDDGGDEEIADNGGDQFDQEYADDYIDEDELA